MYIVLSEEQVGSLQLSAVSDYKINPIRLNDDTTFVLPLQILADNKHSVEIRALLSTFPIREVGDNEWVPAPIDSGINPEGEE